MTSEYAHNHSRCFELFYTTCWDKNGWIVFGQGRTLIQELSDLSLTMRNALKRVQHKQYEIVCFVYLRIDTGTIEYYNTLVPVLEELFFHPGLDVGSRSVSLLYTVTYFEIMSHCPIPMRFGGVASDHPHPSVGSLHY